jgi:hypothetical protein
MFKHDTLLHFSEFLFMFMSVPRQGPGCVLRGSAEADLELLGVHDEVDTIAFRTCGNRLSVEGPGRWIQPIDLKPYYCG